MRNLSRRSAVLAGLGALSLAPCAALADVVTKVGYRAGGEAYEGLVTVEGRTYLYEGGVKFRGGQKEYRGSRYFHEDDGRMAVSEDVEWPDGTKHHYGADGLLSDRPETTRLDGDSLAAGWYTLTCKAGGVLDAYGSDTTPGTRVQSYEANKTQGQRWRVMWDATTEAFRIETSAGVAEAAHAGIDAPGSSVFLWPDLWQDGRGLANQRWRIARDAEGCCTIANADNGFALNAGGKNGTRATMEEPDGSDGQRWVFTPCESWHGWWTDSSGHAHVNDPADGMMVRSCKRVDPANSWDYAAIYDFGSEGTASWHLPTYDDLPNGGAHGVGASVPDITQGDRRQRTLLYALSRVGCPYRLNGRPEEFVCDGLTGWALRMGVGESWPDGDDASWQWALVKGRSGDPSGANMDDLRPGDLVFWGDESGKPLTYYGGAFGNYGYGNYHVGIYYADGKMINARSEEGVTAETPVAEYSSYFGWDYLGGGCPYEKETSVVPIPH